jgi:hypothetical protein
MPRSRSVFGVVAGLLIVVPALSEENSQSQKLGIAAGIGVTAIRATDVVDYINNRFPSSPRLDDFASAAEFFCTAELQIDESWGLKAEYAYLIKSYAIAQGTLGNVDYFYAIHMPMVMAQRTYLHKGYSFKLGGGVGYLLAEFMEQVQGAAARDFTSSGFGFKLEAEGNTSLGDPLYAYIVTDVRGSFMNGLKEDNGKTLPITTGGQENVTMSFFSLGLKLGIIYYL